MTIERLARTRLLVWGQAFIGRIFLQAQASFSILKKFVPIGSQKRLLKIMRWILIALSGIIQKPNDSSSILALTGLSIYFLGETPDAVGKKNGSVSLWFWNNFSLWTKKLYLPNHYFMTQSIDWLSCFPRCCRPSSWQPQPPPACAASHGRTPPSAWKRCSASGWGTFPDSRGRHPRFSQPQLTKFQSEKSIDVTSRL